ncbi:MAG: (Fe-S)-binding protein [Chloroflexota bacterium]
MAELERIISETRAYACLDCGKCTAACPVAHYDPDYSPRKLVASAAWSHEKVLRNGQLWSCITCSMCQERCQSGVQYTELIKRLRTEAHALGGEGGQCSHGGALQSLMHIMTADGLNQDRLGWLDKSLRTAARSDTLYFVGCQPYFDVIFADLGVKTLDTARGAVKLLNRMGIVPALAPNERCCGHDLLWAGDSEGFAKLAEHNLKEITKTGARRVVTTCPECYLTLKEEYPRRLGSLDFEVVHISQLLSEAVADGRLKFRGRGNKKVTYHDPCRLGRLSGIYDQPRSVINAIPGLELAEMPRSRATALCCGTQAWMNCGSVNKQIQAERLREAGSTGADTLITACPKCQIHLKCALNDANLGAEINLQIEDMTSLAARSLAAGGGV